MNRLTNLHDGLRAVETITDRSIKAWSWCMSLAQRCSSMDQLKTIHGIFVAHGIHRNSYAAGKLVSFCALSEKGDLSYASLLFSQLSSPNSFIYNTLIRAYSRSPQPELSLKYFNLMLSNLLHPDGHTFPFVLMACANRFLRFEGQKLHSWVVKNGLFESNAHVQSALVRFYSEHKALADARKVFDDINSVDAVQCNILINGFVKCGMALEALDVFRNMLVRGIEADEFCLTTALTACTHLGALEQGKWIHEYVKKTNLMVSDVFVGTALVDMYAKCGCIDMAVEVFRSMPKRNKFSWAAMIGGYAVHGCANEAIQCLDRMQVEDGIMPDGIIILGVLAACKHAGRLKQGQILLENMETLYGLVPEHEHYSCVVDLLCRTGQLSEALELIRRMPMKPLASVWGALLSSCRLHNNVIFAELAVKELLEVEDGNEAEEDGAYVQLSNIYLAARKYDDARQIRRMIGDKGLKKTPGCSAIEVDGRFHEFIAGDVSHSRLAEIHGVLYLMSVDISTDQNMQESQLPGMCGTMKREIASCAL